jgi:hypothetical protein
VPGDNYPERSLRIIDALYWWAVERDGQSRWTDGEAMLLLPATSGTVMLEIHLAGSMTYVVDAVPAPAGGTERRAAA